jgi:transposase
MESLRRIGFQNGRHENRVYPLSGRIVGSCGQVYTGASRGGSAATRTYRCKGILEGESCGEPHFNADEIESAVWEELLKLLGGKSRLRSMTEERANRLPGDKAKREEHVLDLESRIARQQDLIENRVPEYIKAGVSEPLMKAAVLKLEEELAELRRQHRLAKQWLEDCAVAEGRVHDLVAIGDSTREQLGSMGLAARKEIFEMFDVKVVPRAMSTTLKPGVRCKVSEWHWDTGTLVPPNPTDEEWAAVLTVLRPYFTKRHFVSKYDIRQQFDGMLHRLRQGLSWGDMPLTWGPVNPIRERQLAWWKKGAWPEIMATLKADKRGVQARKRPTLPELAITAVPGRVTC